MIGQGYIGFWGNLNLYIQIAGLSFGATYIDIVEAITVDISDCDAGTCGGEHRKNEAVAVEVGKGGARQPFSNPLAPSPRHVPEIARR